MIIIKDKNTQKVLNIIPPFESGDYPEVVISDNEEILKVSDKTEIENYKEQFRQEEQQSPAFLMQRIREELTILDIQVPRIIEDIVAQTNITLHQSKLDVIARKQELRNQLNNL